MVGKTGGGGWAGARLVGDHAEVWEEAERTKEGIASDEGEKRRSSDSGSSTRTFRITAEPAHSLSHTLTSGCDT